MDSMSESRSVVDGGSLRSVAQGSARSLPAPQEPTNVALYQVRASATPRPGLRSCREFGRSRWSLQPLGPLYALLPLWSGKLTLEENQ